MVRAVIRGDYGNGEERKRRLGELRGRAAPREPDALVRRWKEEAVWALTNATAVLLAWRQRP